MSTTKPFENFLKRFQLFARKNDHLVTIALSNIFTMRLVGNKTHGDLAEIGIAEFVNQYIYDYESTHVGKDLFRKKGSEEDIVIKEVLTGLEIPVSLKAYGIGPLQLSTDKENSVWRYLKDQKITVETNNRKIASLLSSPIISGLAAMSVLPLIYDEKNQRCNIMVFDFVVALKCVSKIEKVQSGNGRKHPIYLFSDKNGDYIFEVRYGGPTANALQRGVWTNSKRAESYFTSATGGWISYEHNLTLVELLSKSLVASEKGHKKALKPIKSDIKRLKYLKS